MDIAAEAARLRAEAEAKPLKLPVNRRVDESHRARTPEGLNVWYTVQVSPRARIHDLLFERSDRTPEDAECRPWLDALEEGRTFVEAPGFPGSLARRFAAFERASGAAPPTA